jgi:hypothetical protein
VKLEGTRIEKPPKPKTPKPDLGLVGLDYFSSSGGENDVSEGSFKSKMLNLGLFPLVHIWRAGL